jgi:hypothetical protein
MAEEHSRPDDRADERSPHRRRRIRERSTASHCRTAALRSGRSGAYDEPMSSIRLLAAVTLVACAAVTYVVSPATAATRCDVSKDGRRLGTTYVTKLTATNVTCTKAKSVVKAFHRCRRAHGGVKGRCTSPVQGFRCTETRESIPTQFDARATCRDGSRAIRFSYEQFT